MHLSLIYARYLQLKKHHIMSKNLNEFTIQTPEKTTPTKKLKITKNVLCLLDRLLKKIALLVNTPLSCSKLANIG